MIFLTLGMKMMMETLEEDKEEIAAAEHAAKDIEIASPDQIESEGTMDMATDLMVFGRDCVCLQRD